VTETYPDAWRSVYDEAVRRADLDTVHDLIAKHGPGILQRGLPYLLVAARNLARDRHRQARRRHESSIDNIDVPDPTDGGDVQAALRLTALSSRLVEALGALGERDAVLLWEGARGSSDEAIAREFVRRGWDSQPASRAAIRKRRERATARLREAFAHVGDDTS
jgi:DNA-directed RNA polymerase specialized sigma24 family protein